MGSGTWSAENFFARGGANRAAGIDTFDYSVRAKQSGRLVAHPSLDPMGLTLRESRDNPDHPESNAILISLDVTGSMGRVVRGIHRDLPRLHELLLGKKYLPDPQVCFAAVGDATCDAVPLQIGQFESDNRMDANLENMILEGGGGGQMTESYELTLYAAARHTALDCHGKRGRKGYLFIIGDEMAYPVVRRAHVHRLIGVDPQADLPLAQIVTEAREKYHVFFVIPGGAHHGHDQGVLTFWQHTLGLTNVLVLDNPDDTSECIAMTIGLTEGVISPAQAQEHLREEKRGLLGKALHGLLTAFGLEKPPASGDVTGTRRL